MRLNDGRVLPAFIGQALRGEDLTIFMMVVKQGLFVMLMTLLRGFISYFFLIIIIQ